MNDQVNELLQKRMDRKNFLKHVGIGMVALTGLGGVFKLLQGQKAAADGYGGNAYGGAPRATAAKLPKRTTL